MSRISADTASKFGRAWANLLYLPGIEPYYIFPTSSPWNLDVDFLCAWLRPRGGLPLCGHPGVLTLLPEGMRPHSLGLRDF
jgi:hypothetical protein